MMSNIIRKISAVSLLLFLMCSCSKTNSNKVTFFYQKKHFSCNFDIVSFKNANYVKLSNNRVLKTIEENVVDSMQMSFQKKVFKGKQVSIMSSHYEESDFLFPVNNKNHIDLVKIQEDEVFTIVIMNEKMRKLIGSNLPN